MAQGEGIAWRVKTHEYRERSTDWFWGLGLLAIAGAGVSIFFGNALLSIILVVGALSIGVLAAREPREHDIHIDTRGIAVDGTLYRYQSLHSFWVEGDSESPRLFVTTTGVLAPHLTLPLQDKTRGASARALLKRHLKEEEQGAHLGEHVAELFGL